MGIFRPFFYTLLVVIIFFTKSNALKCQHQLCRECSEKALDSPSREVKCDIRDLVSTSWLGIPPVSLPDPAFEDIEYACIKMTASNPGIRGDSTDIIKGCTFYVRADYQCQLIAGVELSRGKKNVKCDYCYSDNCNSASTTFIYIPYLLLSVLSIKMGVSG